MSSIGKNIRLLMDERKITIPELALLTQLKEASIFNILHDRTIKPEYINKIALALGVSLEAVWLAQKDPILDVDIHITTLGIIHTLLKYYKVEKIPFPVLQEYIDSVYKFLTDKNDSASSELYIRGMIEGHIKFGIIRPSVGIEHF